MIKESYGLVSWFLFFVYGFLFVVYCLL
jgi:hypothetical protein